MPPTVLLPDVTEKSRDRVQDRATERQRERAERTESILEDVERHLGTVEYPVTTEELATEYADQPIDLPNETESLGSVFDRLVDEEFDSHEEVRETVYGEIAHDVGGGGEANPGPAGETADRNADESGR